MNQFISNVGWKVAQYTVKYYKNIALFLKVITSKVEQSTKEYVDMTNLYAKSVTKRLNDFFQNKKVVKGLTGVVVICGIIFLIYKKAPPPEKDDCKSDTQPVQIISQQLDKISRLPNISKEQSKDKQVVQGQEVINGQQLDEINSLSTLAFKEQYEELKCHITNTLMVEPVHLKCSHDFSKAAIIKHIQKYHNCPLKCPESEGAKIQDLGRSYALEKTVKRFKKKVLRRGRQWLRQRTNEDFEVYPFDFDENQ